MTDSCFTTAPGTSPRVLDADDQLLTIGGVLVVVAPENVEDFLEAGNDYIYGARYDPTGFLVVASGLACGIGDDAVPLTVYATQTDVHAFEVVIDDEQWPDTPRWVPAGLIPCASGTLVCGDATSLGQYVPDPFVPPAESYGVWAVMSLPAAGWMALHVLKPGGRTTAPNLAIRGDWLPA